MIGPQAKPAGLTFRNKAVRPMPFCAGPALTGPHRGRICGLVSRLFVAAPRGVQTSVFGGDEHDEGTGEKPKRRKMQGQNTRREPENGNEKKLFEIMENSGKGVRVKGRSRK